MKKATQATPSRPGLLRRLIRTATAFVIVAVCAFVILRGSDIAHFAFVYTELDDNADLREPLAPWRNQVGLSFIEREATLTQVKTWDDTQKAAARRDDLSDLLAVKPSSSGYWLSLARMRLATKQDIDGVAEALEMSVLTGANEGILMWQRAEFDLMFWDILPPDVRARAAAELQDDSLAHGQAALLRSIVSEKSDQQRQEIRDVLRSRGLSDKLASLLGLI